MTDIQAHSRPGSGAPAVASRFAEGVRHHQAGRVAEAERVYRAILADCPDHAASLNLLGVAAAQGGRLDEAVGHIAAAIAIDRTDPAFYNNLGETLRLRHRLDEAERAFRSAILLAPGYAEAWNNLGVIRHFRGSLAEATIHYRRALDALANYPDALGNIGAAYQEQNQCEQAIVRYRQAIALRHDFVEAHANLGQALLSRGDFAQGWREYEWRRRLDSFRQVAPPGQTPEWQGEDISGRTILLYGEQGLGDCLQFVRYATAIAGKGATVVLDVHPSLVRLLASVEGASRVVSREEPRPPCDTRLSLVSAPHRLGTTLETIPASVPYVRPDPADVARWAGRLADLSGLKVGLAWAGDPRPYDQRAHAIDKRRSIPLVRFAPLLAMPGISVVSLQKGAPASQVADLTADLRPYDWMGDVDDFADTAALVANLDLIVTVDTSVAHLAGAMGKAVWILSRFDGCWRWLHDRDDSPWYPSARLFRQEAPDDWEAVIIRVVGALRQVADGHAPLIAARRAGPAIANASDEVTPSQAKAFYARGVALQTEGRPLDAEAAYRAALAADPDLAVAYNNMGNILAAQNRREEALTAYRSALEKQPDYAEAHYNLGHLMHRDGRLAEAVSAYREALRCAPFFQEALVNLGAAFQELGRPSKAEAVQRICLAITPDAAVAWLNLSVTLKNQGRIDEALITCRRALACQQDHALAHVNLAHLLLLTGAFDEGWREYEWRWKGGAPGLVVRFSDALRWTGQSLAGKTLLLHAEQGLGDSLHFIRYAPLLAQAGATVVVECQAPLIRLFTGQRGIDQVAAMETGLPPFDYHLPMMSAPGVLGTDLATIPADSPYLEADPEMIAAWGRRLVRLRGLKVGLVWAGDPRRHDYRFAAADRQRSIPLEQLRPLLSLPGVGFVSLQKGEAATQIGALPPELRPLDLMDDVSDFADTAALLANLDLLITVDTSVAHLAGAMGKPVWIASRFDGCWRWLQDREDSPWYPTARLFRQDAADDWRPVVDRLATALREATARGSIEPGPKPVRGGKQAPAENKNGDDGADRRLLAEARAHHLSDRLAEAEQGYRRLLARRADHPDGLFLMGAVALQTGRGDLALTLLRRFLALMPSSPEGHNNLGNALKALGGHTAAREAYRRALVLKEKYPEPRVNLGKIWLDLESPGEAAVQFLRAIALRPLDAHARYCLGVARQEQGRAEDAATAYRTALTLAPADPLALNNLGNALKDLGSCAEAAAALRRAIVVKPDFWEAFYNLALALQSGGLLADAEVALKACLAIRADYPRAHNNLGVVLKAEGRCAEALAAFRQAIHHRPDYGEAYTNLGVTLMELERRDRAIAAYHAAIACGPEAAEPQNNLGVAFQQMGRLDEAIAAYDRAVALAPDYAEAHTNRGMALLARGDDDEGWRDYEWRWKGGLADLSARDFPCPGWQGEDLRGRTILLHGEQGFGDVLQFVRYAPLVAARAGQVVLEAYPPLVRLLKSLAAPLTIVATGDPLPAVDCQAPLMSLPHIMGAAPGKAVAIPYLRPIPEDAAVWRTRLAGLGRPRVGVVWAGNPRRHDPGAHAVDRRRSVPLSALTPLLSEPDIEVVSVQTGEAAFQLRQLDNRDRPWDASPDLTDFADTAGLLANLDLLISVDTAAVHLAGAMGKPVWILSRFDGCWRWGADRNDSPWYPTVKLYRQRVPGDWNEVIGRLRGDLRRWIDER